MPVPGRDPATRDRIERFLRELGRRYRGTGRLYLVGGTQMVWAGFRRQTDDVDYSVRLEGGEQAFTMVVRSFPASTRSHFALTRRTFDASSRRSSGSPTGRSRPRGRVIAERQGPPYVTGWSDARRPAGCVPLPRPPQHLPGDGGAGQSGRRAGGRGLSEQDPGRGQLAGPGQAASARLYLHRSRGSECHGPRGERRDRTMPRASPCFAALPRPYSLSPLVSVPQSLEMDLTMQAQDRVAIRIQPAPDGHAEVVNEAQVSEEL